MTYGRVGGRIYDLFVMLLYIICIMGTNFTSFSATRCNHFHIPQQHTNHYKINSSFLCPAEPKLFLPFAWLRKEKRFVSHPGQVKTVYLGHPGR